MGINWNDYNTALYIHWPFCLKKCPYCDFNSHVQENVEHTRWEKAYLRSLEHFAEYLHGRTITSIFFGGGTPTLMPPHIAERIIEKAASLASLAENVEITLEGNPTSVEAGKLKDFKQAGINRVSLGVQSLKDNSLAFLGREHSAKEALKAVDTARNLFSRYSFDLIYALPGQSAANWEQELQEALNYAEGHLSLYQLTIEKGTPFFSQHQKKHFTLPAEEQAEELYRITDGIMASAAMPAYEISNYARTGEAARHNLNYWYYEDYLGIGPGAHSRITKEGQKHALMMWHAPEKWLNEMEAARDGAQDNTPLSKAEAKKEWLLMRLRLAEPVSHATLLNQLCLTQEKDTHNYHALLNRMEKEELLSSTKQHFQLSLKGRLVLNSIAAHMAGELI